MKIDLFWIDAFASRPFSGNPAAVCPLLQWLPDSLLQSIAAENNLSETAFFIPKGTGFELRWFTPKIEVDLCGHATLASAYVIFNHLGHKGDEVEFETRFAGNLKVTRKSEFLTLDFPSRPPEPCQVIPREVIEGLGGAQPRVLLVARDYIVVYDREEQVHNAKPDFRVLGNLGRWICITAPGDEVDFVSRFFCPGDGIEEDPVTGSTHCALTPYWAQKFGKKQMHARQLSKRGGELECLLSGDRVLISGQARLYMQGVIQIPQ